MHFEKDAQDQFKCFTSFSGELHKHNIYDNASILEKNLFTAFYVGSSR